MLLSCGIFIGSFLRASALCDCSKEPCRIPATCGGANYCDIAVHTDHRAGWVVTVSAIDNLIKGAAGQAIQAMNLMLGYPEETGLVARASTPSTRMHDHLPGESLSHHIGRAMKTISEA